MLEKLYKAIGSVISKTSNSLASSDALTHVAQEAVYNNSPAGQMALHGPKWAMQNRKLMTDQQWQNADRQHVIEVIATTGNLTEIIKDERAVFKLDYGAEDYSDKLKFMAEVVGNSTLSDESKSALNAQISGAKLQLSSDLRMREEEIFFSSRDGYFVGQPVYGSSALQKSSPEQYQQQLVNALQYTNNLNQKNIINEADFSALQQTYRSSVDELSVDVTQRIQGSFDASHRGYFVGQPVYGTSATQKLMPVQYRQELISSIQYANNLNQKNIINEAGFSALQQTFRTSIDELSADVKQRILGDFDASRRGYFVGNTQTGNGFPATQKSTPEQYQQQLIGSIQYANNVNQEHIINETDLNSIQQTYRSSVDELSVDVTQKIMVDLSEMRHGYFVGDTQTINGFPTTRKTTPEDYQQQLTGVIEYARYLNQKNIMNSTAFDAVQESYRSYSDELNASISHTVSSSSSTAVPEFSSSVVSSTAVAIGVSADSSSVQESSTASISSAPSSTAQAQRNASSSTGTDGTKTEDNQKQSDVNTDNIVIAVAVVGSVGALGTAVVCAHRADKKREEAAKQQESFAAKNPVAATQVTQIEQSRIQGKQSINR
jgi:hypothetical protein